MYQYLKKGYLIDLSQCFLQVKASTEDMKSMSNVFETLLTSIISYTEETKNVLCERNTTHSIGEITLPLAKSVLLMPSPLIKININCADEKNDLHKLLQFTPAESKSYYYNLKKCIAIPFLHLWEIVIVNMLLYRFQLRTNRCSQDTNDINRITLQISKRIYSYRVSMIQYYQVPTRSRARVCV